MPKRRVVITGMGILAPNGKNIQDFWEALKAGKSGIRNITYFETEGLPVKIAGEVGDISPELKILEEKNILNRKEVRRTDPFLIYALTATDEAIGHSGLDLSKEDSYRIGTVIGSGRGGVKIWENDLLKFVEKGPKGISPFTIPGMIPDMAAGLVAIKYKVNGPNYNIASACSSAGHAIGGAFRIIQNGEADIMITGGTEAPITAHAVTSFAIMKALSTRDCPPEEASCPFDQRRDGFVVGEGAGILILEELEHAKKREARIYAEIASFGQTNDSYHITAPDPTAEPAAKCMEFALKDAGINPSEVSLINAHGTSTELNDISETKAIKTVFGDQAYKIPIQATKSMIGHLLGAASAAELIATIKSMEAGIIHPTINYQEPDPECDLDYVPNQAREAEVRVAISNSFGFGGHNVCLVIKKFES